MSDWVTLRDALGLTLRPIDAWPGRIRASRDLGPFSADLKDTLRVLKKEMAALGARNVILQVAFREQDLRLDGLPRAGAVATHPGVILAFDSRQGALRLHFDGFTHWRNNLRALAMHLEHLRLAGLYGVGTDGQQYQGWKALPAPNAVGPMSDPYSGPYTAAAQFIAACANWSTSRATEILSSRAVLDESYRYAAKLVHPDRGGDHERFVQLQAAHDLLWRAHP